MFGQGAIPTAGFSRGDVAEYYSRTHGAWIECIITAVDARSGCVQIDLKPGAWHKGRDVIRPPGGFSLGDEAEYYSRSYGAWIECIIIAVDARSGSVQIDRKQGAWLGPDAITWQLRSKGDAGY